MLLSKKQANKKRKERGEPEDDVDVATEQADMEAIELEAEIAALRSMQSEQPDNNVESGKVWTYNKEGLLQALEGMATNTLPFAESFHIGGIDLDVKDEHDDLEREVFLFINNCPNFVWTTLTFLLMLQMSFYNHTLKAVQMGRKALETAGIPSRRPVDFFCENIKSDAHMIRVI